MLKKNDVFMINEHWLHFNKLHLLNEIDSNFNWHARASKSSSEEMYGLKRGQGGVAILWNKDLNGISIIETLDHDRICAIRMENQNGSAFIFISVYLPANGSKENMSVIFDELAGFIDDLGHECIPIIVGDFNGDLGALGGPRGHGQPNRHGTIIHKFMNEFNLKSINLADFSKGPVNTFSGHNGSSAIDHIMVPHFFIESNKECHVGRNDGLNTSDHLPIEATLSIPLMPRKILIESKSKRVRWEKLSDIGLAKRFCHVISNGLFEIEERLTSNIPDKPCDVDRAFDNIVLLLHRAAALIPKCKFKKISKPFWC